MFFSKKNLILSGKLILVAMAVFVISNVTLASTISDFSFTAVGNSTIATNSTNNLALEVVIPDGTNGAAEDTLIRDGSNVSWGGAALIPMSANEYFMDNNYDGAYQSNEAIVNSADGVLDPGEVIASGDSDITSFKSAGTPGAEYVFDDTANDDNTYTPGEAIWSDNDGSKSITGGDNIILPGLSSVMNFNSPGDPVLAHFEDGGLCGGVLIGIHEMPEAIWDDGPSPNGLYNPGMGDVILSDPNVPPGPPCLAPVIGAPGTAFSGPPAMGPPPPPGSESIYLDTNHNGIYDYMSDGGVPGNPGNGEPIIMVDSLAAGIIIPNGGSLIGPGNPGGPETVLPAYASTLGGDLGIGGTYLDDWVAMSDPGIGPFYFIGTTMMPDVFNGNQPIMQDTVLTNNKLDPGEIISSGTTPAMAQTWGTMKHTGGGAYASTQDIYDDTGANVGTLDKKADQLNAITIQNNGTADNSDISAMKIWKDGGDGNFNGGDDTLLGTATWDGADSWDISGLTTAIPAGGLKLFISVDTAASPTDGSTIDLMIPQIYDAGTSGAYNSGDEGLFVASTNDGPSDGNAKPASNNVLTIDVTLTPPTAVCGNGTLENGEECDDGNTTDGDGCSSTCTTEGDGHLYEEVEDVSHEDVVTVAEGFSDYDETFWSAAYIAKLFLEGVVEGYPDGTFGIGNNTTRAEIVKIVLLANNIEIPETVTEPPFPDTPIEEWYTVYVDKAKELEIVEGYPDGEFKPGNNVNRVEALKIMLLGKSIDTTGYPTGGLTFTDIDANGWYIELLAYAVANDIVSGYSDNTFKPGQEIVRAEIAKIAVKVMLLGT